MAATISEPKVIERGPCNVVGAYAVYEGDDEGPAWGQASAEFDRRRGEGFPNHECGSAMKPPWEVFAESRGCNLIIDVDDGDYLFFYLRL